MNESEYYLAFSNAPGVGPIKFEKLRKAFGSAEEAWEAEQTELEQILKPVLTSKFLEFREIDAVRVDILVGGEKVDALSIIVYKPKAESLGRRMVGKLKEVLPRQNFLIAIQAAIGGKIIARESVSPFRKDVTAKLYGGDRTRKDKLLEKQKKGKKKMKMVGRVEIPQEAFLSILKS